MRYIRYAILALVAIALITVALANRDVVTLNLLPDEIAALFGINTSWELPLFLVIFAGVIAGLLIGFVWEWIREHKQRAVAGQVKRDAVRLEREVARLREEKHAPGDDVLALLEENGTSR